MTVATMRLVTRDDPNAVLFDFDDGTGARNPFGIKTFLTYIDLGEVDRPVDLVKAKGGVLSARAISDPQPRVVALEFVVDSVDRTMKTLAAGIDQLFGYLTSSGVVDTLLAWDDGGGTRFFEPIGLEKATPNLRSDNSEANVAYGTDQSLTLEITCQPYLVSPELDSDTNVVTNATLGVEGSTSGRPDAWAWDTTSNISAEAIDATKEAYAFNIATTSTRNLQQTTPAGTAVAGSTYTDSFYVRAAAAGVVKAQAVIRFCNSSGTPLGTESVGTLTDVSTFWTRLSVSAVAPSSTDRILVTLRFSNGAATSTQVWVRDAQAEPGALGTFHAGFHLLDSDAANTYGMMFPLVVAGSAPTPVTFDVEARGTMKMTSLQMGARWNEDDEGTNKILDFQNKSHWLPAGTSQAGWTVTTESLGGGNTNSDSDAFGSNGLTISVGDGNVGVRLRRWRAVRSTFLDSLRGEWLVLGRFDARESDVDWSIQLQYGSANIDPVPYTNAPATYTIERQGNTIDTTLTPYDYIALGKVKIPETGPIGAVRMELWVKRTDNVTVGVANLRFGGLILIPNTPNTLLEVPGIGRIDWSNDELANLTPKLDGAGGGNYDPSNRVGDGGIQMDRPGEAMGVKPSTGQAYGTGRTRITFDISNVGQAQDTIDNSVDGLSVRVIRISGGAGQAIIIRSEVHSAKSHTIEFDANSGELYIPQAIHNGDPGRRFTVDQITKRFVPYIDGSIGERLVSDPENLEVTKRDSSLNVQTLCDVSGQTPFVLEPGRYIVVMAVGEVKRAGHPNDNTPLGHTFKVRTRYSPRWTQ